METNINEESRAFDHQIIERVKNGHIPDLRRTQECKYFYNNTWRQPEYVQLDMNEQFQLIEESLRNYVRKSDQPTKVLEVGCGPGWLTLELARTGYDVIGIDVSPECIAVAENFANVDPWKEHRSRLQYINGDIFCDHRLEPGIFDAVIFLGALHHFADQEKVMATVAQLLHPEGIILAHEPTRDRVTEGNASLIHLMQVLLSIQGGYYQTLEIPTDAHTLNLGVKHILQTMKYEDETGDKLQSVNDNEAGHKEMYSALTDKFYELAYRERYSFFHEIIGGLRFDKKINIALATYLKNIDSKFCELGIMQPTEFFFVGRNRSESVPY